MDGSERECSAQELGVQVVLDYKFCLLLTIGIWEAFITSSDFLDSTFVPRFSYVERYIAVKKPTFCILVSK